MSMGTQIKEAREAIGWTQAELAAEVGVNPTTVFHWENGKFNPKDPELVGEVLGVTLEDAEWKGSDWKRVEPTLGEQIKAARTERGWSQQQLGDRVGVQQPVISQFERGIATPDIDKLKALADALGVSIGGAKPAMTEEAEPTIDDDGCVEVAAVSHDDEDLVAQVKVRDAEVARQAVRATNLKDRIRAAAQSLIEAIGAPGPESLEDTVQRVLAELKKAHSSRERALANERSLQRIASELRAENEQLKAAANVVPIVDPAELARLRENYEAAVEQIAGLREQLSKQDTGCVLTIRGSLTDIARELVDMAVAAREVG